MTSTRTCVRAVLGLLLTSCLAAQCPITSATTAFTGWSASATFNTPPTNTFSAAAVSSGGNPGDAYSVTESVQAGVMGAGIALAHFPPAGTPLPPSGLHSLDVSYDASMLAESPLGAFGGAVGTYIVLEQGGIPYWSATSSVIWLGTGFQTFSASGLTQSSFVTFDAVGSHPNFATGGPIRVGFATSNGNGNGGVFPGGATVGTTTTLFDNVVVSFAAAAAVVATVPGCAGGVPPALSVLSPVLGATATVSLTGAAPLAPGAIYTSVPPAMPTPIGGGCLIGLDFATAAELLSFSTDAAGTFSVAFGLPPACPLAGFSAAVQAYVVDPTAPLGVALTNGLVVVLGF